MNYFFETAVVLELAVRFITDSRQISTQPVSAKWIDLASTIRKISRSETFVIRPAIFDVAISVNRLHSGQ